MLKVRAEFKKKLLMYRLLKIVVFVSILATFTNSLYAQDPQFSQFYANPLFLNPAFAGATECGRLNFNYRNQWPALSKAFITYNISYDQNIPGINSGIGLLVMSDQQGDNALNRLNASGFYSYKLKLTSDFLLSFGVKATYYQESLNWQKFIFSDQIETTSGNHDKLSQETPPDNSTVTAIDFSAGTIFSYLDKFFVGVAVDHLTQPNISFYNNSNSILPMKIAIHGGITANLSEGTLGNARQEDWVLQPNILYLQQEMFHQLNAGIYISKYPFVLGAWFRHNFQNPDAAIVLVGITYNNIKLGYSYDITMSNIGGSAGGAHEISFSWNFCIYKQEKRRHIRAIKSPSF